MAIKLPNRRRFLAGLAAGSSGLALSGCDLLDGLGGPQRRIRGVLEAANDLTYRVQRFVQGGNSLAREYTSADIRQAQRPNGITAPDDEDYLALAADNFSAYRLEVSGLVENPLSLSREQLMAMPSRTQTTRHDCVEGWSCIAQWTGVPLASVLAMATAKPQARFAMFHCFDTIERGLSGSFKYYETIDLIDANHPQTILAYGHEWQAAAGRKRRAAAPARRAPARLQDGQICPRHRTGRRIFRLRGRPRRLLGRSRLRLVRRHLKNKGERRLDYNQFAIAAPGP